MDKMKIEQLGEFGLIERINSLLPTPGKDVIMGIGDDVAVLRSDGGRVWLTTCDVQVEGAHFLREAIQPHDLGRKALAINLSDIAATGGRPRFALISLGLPKQLPVEFIDELYKGLQEEASQFGVDIVGGNISSSRLGMFIDIFLIGDALAETVLLRSAAQPGDCVLVTGSLGDAAAGVAMLLNKDLTSSTAYSTQAVKRRDTPTPRVKIGQLIGESKLAHAMIDISDGLASDLGHICEKSNVGVNINAEALPVAEENRALSKQVHGFEWYFALYGGEDYELLFTASPENANRLKSKIESETGVRVTIIGEIKTCTDGRQLTLKGQKVMPLEARGWDHFKENK